MKDEAVNPRTLTHGVLSDIDNILEEVRQRSASEIVWNKLFAGWDDDNNSEYADYWIKAEAGPIIDDNDEFYAFWETYESLRHNFTGPQVRQYRVDTAGPKLLNDFSPLWRDTENNCDAAAYQYEVTGILPIVRPHYTSTPFQLPSDFLSLQTQEGSK